MEPTAKYPLFQKTLDSNCLSSVIVLRSYQLGEAGTCTGPASLGFDAGCQCDILSTLRSVPSFHFDRAREQNIILKVNVLVQIGFKSCQCLV